MSGLPIEKEILESLRDLSEMELSRVLAYVRSVKKSPLRGVPGKEMTKFAGLFPPDVIEEMRLAIEEGCERVDPDGW